MNDFPVFVLLSKMSVFQTRRAPNDHFLFQIIVIMIGWFAMDPFSWGLTFSLLGTVMILHCGNDYYYHYGIMDMDFANIVG